MEKTDGLRVNNQDGQGPPQGELERLQERISQLEERLAELSERVPEDKLAMVVFSGDLDRVLAAFVIATGAAAMGMEVTMFFTFWGLSAIRRKKKMAGKRFMQKMMALMSPASTKGLGVSKLNFFGLGAKMLRAMMKQQGVSSLEELMELARQLGVRLVSCDMSQQVMGIEDDELLEGVEFGGVGTFLGEALKARTALFI